MHTMCSMPYKPELDCRHYDGFCNTVCAHQFWEQTTLKTRKDLSELVCEWTDTFPKMCRKQQRVS